MCGELELDIDLYYDTLEVLQNHKIKTTLNRPNVTGVARRTQWGRNIGTNKYDTVGFPMESQNFGLVYKRFMNNGTNKVKYDQPFQEGNNNNKYPAVYEQLKKLINHIDPDFTYTSITLNHNFKCLPHYDKKNKSPSIIIGLGDYTGGELIVEDCKIDIHFRPLIFNGSVCEHSTADFTGDRYTVIYYSI